MNDTKIRKLISILSLLVSVIAIIVSIYSCVIVIHNYEAFNRSNIIISKLKEEYNA